MTSDHVRKGDSVGAQLSSKSAQQFSLQIPSRRAILRARLCEMRREKVYLAQEAATSDAVFWSELVSDTQDVTGALTDGLDA